MSAAAEILTGARFLWRLPGFLRNRLTLEEARRVLEQRLEHCDSDFLTLAKRAIYEYPASPYYALLKNAGCEYGDLERLVRAEGLEEALQRLLCEGVYVSVAEYKGRQPIVRNNVIAPSGPAALANPLAARHVPLQSSGSRGGGVLTVMDLAAIRDHGVNACLVLDAWGGNDWVKGVWTVPGGGALFRLLKFSSFGHPIERWFSQVDPAAAGLHPRYRWSARLLRWTSLAAGFPVPRVEVAALDDPLPVVHWMAAVVQRGQTPWVRTLPSSAVHAAVAAVAAKIDLTGAHFTVSGEPITESKMRAIRASGARVTPRYGTVECGSIAYGCLAPESSDDMHLFHDHYAMVQRDGDRGLFMTSLRSTTPNIMLNLSMGDEAKISRRRCGCPLEPMGWTTHLSQVRSQEKLTAEGMTFLDLDVVRLLEEVLPQRFGGVPTDYQLVEQEQNGLPTLRLLIHPRIGDVDPRAVIEVALQTMGQGSGAERVMALAWQDAGVFKVERRAPFRTHSGKILHLHVQ